MKIDRFTIPSCCGKTSLMFKTDQPLTKKTIESLVGIGFKELTHFTQAGILYVDNSDFIMTGPLGSDKLQVKCKFRDCEQKLNLLEESLKNIG